MLELEIEGGAIGKELLRLVSFRVLLMGIGDQLPLSWWK